MLAKVLWNKAEKRMTSRARLAVKRKHKICKETPKDELWAFLCHQDWQEQQIRELDVPG
jgi:hypothetical protein